MACNIEGLDPYASGLRKVQLEEEGAVLLLTVEGSTEDGKVLLTPDQCHRLAQMLTVHADGIASNVRKGVKIS